MIILDLAYGPDGEITLITVSQPVSNHPKVCERLQKITMMPIHTMTL